MSIQIGPTTVFRHIARHLQKCSMLGSRLCSSLVQPADSPQVLPLVQFPDHGKTRSFMKPREALVESLCDPEPVGLISLHPEVFAQFPILRVIQENIRWQNLYKRVNMVHINNRSECRGGGRKPWPQKGLGKARHGSIRSPLFKNGGIAHGPRKFTGHFFMLPYNTRLQGLTCTLSAKFAQDDIKVVKDLELPSADPQYLSDLVDDRIWGPSVLFVDADDMMPENITLATDAVPHINLMPVYGLNVYSMLKHTTLVLTVAAVRRIEERMIHHTNGVHRRFAGDEFSSKCWGL